MKTICISYICVPLKKHKQDELQKSVSSLEEALFAWDFHPLKMLHPPSPPFEGQGGEAMFLSQIEDVKFRQDALDGGLAPLVLACRCGDAFVGQRLGDAVQRHALEEHSVDVLDHLDLLRVDYRIPIFASVVAEEPFETITSKSVFLINLI